VGEFAREVNQFLRDGKVDVDSFLKELGRLNPALSQRLGRRHATAAVRRRSRA
jgi:hypothetical protein